MSLSKRSLRTHALGMVRGRIAAGRYTKADLARWEEELGPVVHELVAELSPKKKSKKKSSSKAGDE